jgi:anaerobic magnesium-protoporphyrin IX monomethyl ester cyclase
MLTAFLRQEGIDVLPIDANVEAYDRLLRAQPLATMAERVRQKLARLDKKASLDHPSRREYLQLWRARGDAEAAPAGIAEARAILKDEARFFDADSYESAVETIESSLRLISAAHAPLELSFSGYRTPFALTTPDEIAFDADAARDPFDDYVVHVLVPRLQAAKVDAIGISVCFPGQLQPAYAFALKLKQLMPDVHLTCGGPGITQLLIRLKGRDLERALGPFDSAVVFEGEHSLLNLCRALDEKRPLRGLPNVVHRDLLLGAKYAAGEGAEDLRVLPAPDFDGLPLDLYFAPQLALPYDPTRGCYWGKCTFCHYGLAETGTASYRERGHERAVDHLQAMREKYGTRWFYLSQDSVAPKTLLKIAQEIERRGLDIKWATDLKPEKYLTAERARALKAGGGIACALGVESANPRVLEMIDKGAPVSTVRETITHLADAGLAVEAMCFTDFPTETYAEAMDTLDFLKELELKVALYIVGEFDLTHGALVAQTPERFGLRETWQLDGDLLGTGLFYEEKRVSKRPGDLARLEGALDRLSSGWRVRRYPWAGSLSTAHSLLHYAKLGPGVFRDRATRPPVAPLGARSATAAARFDLAQVASSDRDELAIWHQLVRQQRHVSRAAYTALARALPPLLPRPRRYQFIAGQPPAPARAAAKAKGRRPPNASNAAG